MERPSVSSEHFLVRHARRYPIVDRSLAPTDCTYDPKLGAWVTEATGEIYVNSPDPARRPPGTKKADLETGEDQKGT
jgi:hypothetical protein